MKLRVLKNKANKIILSKPSKDSKIQDKSLHINYAVNYNTDKEDVFVIVFNVQIVHPEEFDLQIEFFTWFKTSENIDEEFKASDFPKINAPAIAYPFLRSLITTITINSGYRAAFLPSINFVEASKEIYKEISWKQAN